MPSRSSARPPRKTSGRSSTPQGGKQAHRAARPDRGVSNCRPSHRRFGTVEERVEHLRVHPRRVAPSSGVTRNASDVVRRDRMIGRQIFRALPGCDHREPAGPPPVDQFTGERRLVANRERVDDPAARASSASSGPASASASTLTMRCACPPRSLCGHGRMPPVAARRPRRQPRTPIAQASAPVRDELSSGNPPRIPADGAAGRARPIGSNRRSLRSRLCVVGIWLRPSSRTYPPRKPDAHGFAARCCNSDGGSFRGGLIAARKSKSALSAPARLCKSRCAIHSGRSWRAIVVRDRAQRQINRCARVRRDVRRRGMD